MMGDTMFRSARLNGTGTLAVKGSIDFGSLGTAENVTLGTAPAIAPSYSQVAANTFGERHSFQFGDASGSAWMLDGVGVRVVEFRFNNRQNPFLFRDTFARPVAGPRTAVQGVGQPAALNDPSQAFSTDAADAGP